jgi:hypothetical protein
MSTPIRSSPRVKESDPRLAKHAQALQVFERSMPKISRSPADATLFNVKRIIDSGIHAMELLQHGLRKISRRTVRGCLDAESQLDDACVAKAMLDGSVPVDDLPGDADIWARALEELQEQKKSA